MADDIVTRLYCSYSDPPCESCTFCAARAEIERLRAENARLASFLHPIGAVANLRCDCNRYRPCRHCMEARRG